jgi:hypothetical protein
MRGQEAGYGWKAAGAAGEAAVPAIKNHAWLLVRSKMQFSKLFLLLQPAPGKISPAGTYIKSLFLWSTGALACAFFMLRCNFPALKRLVPKLYLGT